MENKNKQLKEYLKDRDEILSNIESLTLNDIVKYCVKWNVPMPPQLFAKEEWVKGGLHKSRLNVTKLEGKTDEELKQLQIKSMEALDKLGWDYGIR